jgi:hypothetical protein
MTEHGRAAILPTISERRNFSFFAPFLPGIQAHPNKVIEPGRNE